MSEDLRRAQARRRLKIKRDFGWHLVTYLLVNGLLVFVWSIDGGGFWPVWTMVPWGIGLGFHAWYAFAGRPITDDDVERELERAGRSGGRAKRGRRRPKRHDEAG